MDNKIITLEDQCELFTLFHDGNFTPFHKKGHEVEFRLEIEYLAAMIDPAYRDFSVVFKQCHYYAFKPWDNTVPDEDIDVINTYIEDMQILSAKSKDNQVHVFCDGGPTRAVGEFIFRCDRIGVRDEEGEAMTLDALQAIAKRYWEEHNPIGANGSIAEGQDGGQGPDEGQLRLSVGGTREASSLALIRRIKAGA